MKTPEILGYLLWSIFKLYFSWNSNFPIVHCCFPHSCIDVVSQTWSSEPPACNFFFWFLYPVDSIQLDQELSPRNQILKWDFGAWNIYLMANWHWGPAYWWYVEKWQPQVHQSYNLTTKEFRWGSNEIKCIYWHNSSGSCKLWWEMITIGTVGSVD